MLRKIREGAWTLIEILVAVTILVIVAAIVVPAITNPNPTQTFVNNLAGSIEPTATIGSLYSSDISGTGAANASVTTNASWLTYNAGTLSGTPDGNDFGRYTATVTLNDSNGRQYTATQTITVAPPTLTVDAPGEFVVPYHSRDSITFDLVPPPENSYIYSYSHTILTGPASVTPAGPTATNNLGEGSFVLNWSHGFDFTGEASIVLVSNAPGGGTITLGPIPSRSE